MVKDAEANATADKERSDQIDTKNQSEALCYQTKQQLEQLEHGPRGRNPARSKTT